MSTMILYLYILGDFLSGGKPDYIPLLLALFFSAVFLIGSELASVRTFVLFPAFIPKLISVIVLFFLALSLSAVQRQAEEVNCVLLGLTTVAFLFFSFITLLSVLREEEQ